MVIYSDVCMSVWTAQYDVSIRHRQCILSGGVRTGTPEHSVLSSVFRTVIASYQQSLCMAQSQQREPAQQREYFPRRNRSHRFTISQYSHNMHSGMVSYHTIIWSHSSIAYFLSIILWSPITTSHFAIIVILIIHILYLTTHIYLLSHTPCIYRTWWFTL